MKENFSKLISVFKKKTCLGGGGEGVKSWLDTYQTNREGKNAESPKL